MDEHTPEPAQENQVKSKKLKQILLLSATTKLPFLKKMFASKWARIGAVAVVAVPLVGLLAWWGWNNSSLSKLGVDAALVEGTAQFRVSAEHPWDKLQEGMSLAEGVEVRTMEDSRAVLNIDDGSAVRLNSESSVVLTKLASRHIVVTNTGGDVYTRVVKSEDRTFQVAAGDATYESLGTAYRTLNSEEKSGVEVYHSKVNILGLKADDTVLVKQGERYYVVNKTAADLEGKVTELSLDELAADDFVKWNSEQDKKDFEKELGVLFDLTPPTLEITTPVNGAVTEASSVEVKGTAEAGAKVLVNGAEVANTDGQFVTTVNLNEGANGIKVEASDSAGNKTVKDITITRNAPAPAASSTSFKLVGTKVDKGVSFTWNLSGIAVSQGFKLLLSKSGTPTYGAKDTDSVYIKSSSARSYTWELTNGKTYNFRICVYTGSGCSHYSNTISLTVPYVAPTPPSGSLTLNYGGSGANVNWSISGGTALYGYKLVWSPNPDPTYPGSGDDEAKFYDKNDLSGSIDESSGTYYVKICMYYEGSCVNYSNPVTVTP